MKGTWCVTYKGHNCENKDPWMKKHIYICLLYSMQSKSPNTVNKVVEEVPSVGCTIGERRGHCPCCPTQFLLAVHFPSQVPYQSIHCSFSLPHWQHCSQWHHQEHPIRCVSPRMRHQMQIPSTAFWKFPNFTSFVQVVEGMLQVGCPSCSPQSYLILTAKQCCMKL